MLVPHRFSTKHHLQGIRELLGAPSDVFAAEQMDEKAEALEAFDSSATPRGQAFSLSARSVLAVRSPPVAGPCEAITIVGKIPGQLRIYEGVMWFVVQEESDIYAQAKAGEGLVTTAQLDAYNGRPTLYR